MNAGPNDAVWREQALILRDALDLEDNIRSRDV
jgi:hypothetical protein